MSNVIVFLEQMGKNAALSRLEGEEFAAAVDALGLDDALVWRLQRLQIF